MNEHRRSMLGMGWGTRRLPPPDICKELKRIARQMDIMEEREERKMISDMEFHDMDVYQAKAMRTCNIPYDDKTSMLRHAVFGLTSEAGEVAGILQKEYQGHEIDKEHLKKELGDCLWMIAEACEALNITMSDVAGTNIDKLLKRYPVGFEAERSLNRAEDDI